MRTIPDIPPELSIILPAYNEGTKIKTNIKHIQEKLSFSKINYEIVIVDDGSRDNTFKEAQECETTNIRILSYSENRGKGFAINHGIQYSRGEFKLFMDADLSTSLDEIEKFLEVIKSSNLDMVVGSRKQAQSRLLRKQPFYRIFLGNIFTALACLFAGYRLSDYTCGFKMYSRKAADIIFKRQRIYNWAFDAELIYIAAQHGLKIAELPVVWRNDPQTKVRLLKDIVTSFLGLIQIRLNHSKGFYQ